MNERSILQAAISACPLALALPWAVFATGDAFLTGFENAETPAYQEGHLDGQGGAERWTVMAGSVSVQTGTVAHGNQAVELDGGSIARGSVGLSNEVVWTDLFLSTDGATNPPIIPEGSAAVVLYFSATNGLLALDGNGAGTGTYTQVAAAWPSNRFARISVRQDFSAKTYDVWLDGTNRAIGLGFKDNSIEELQAVDFVSGPTGYLDSFSVTEEGLGNDSDTDGLSDLDEVKFTGTSPTEADTDEDGSNDGDEVFAGTDATNRDSVFVVTISAGTEQSVSFLTVTQRLYTVQVATNMATQAWSDLPGYTDIHGDGLMRTYSVEVPGEPSAYRVRVRRP